MRKVLFSLIVVALLVTVAGCTEGNMGISSDDIPDPTTQWLHLRDSVYNDVHNAAKRGAGVTLDLRILYAQMAISSYAYGYETESQFRDHLILIDFPDGSQLTAQAYEFKSVIAWLLRGQIDLDSANKRLTALSNQRRGNRGW